MKERMLIRAACAAIVCAAIAACAPGPAPAEVADAAKDLRLLVPAIQAGLALAVPDSPTSRALDPTKLETSGVENPWNPSWVTPADAYTAAGGGTGTRRFPTSGYYQDAAGNQLYFALTPQTDPYYTLVLYTYPAFDLVVDHTVEEYLVDPTAVASSWPWENLNASFTRNAWISYETVYIDGTSGKRTVQGTSATWSAFYPAFTVTEPVPGTTESFDGYRYEELDNPPTASSGSGTWSSSTTETIKAKGSDINSSNFYTETSATSHSGLTYVLEDQKNKHLDDTKIVTRMVEDTTAGTKTIRSVGEVGSSQYYIDKVDISGSPIEYTSTHDVYDTSLPRAGGDASAQDYVFIDLLEDAPDTGTYTGTMEQTQGSKKYVYDVTIKRDSRFRLAMGLKLKSSGSRSLGDDISIPLTKVDIGNLSIALPGVQGTFDGYYEQGTLYGSIRVGAQVYAVVVAEQGIVLDDRLYVY